MALENMIFKSWQRERSINKKIDRNMNKITPFRYFLSQNQPGFSKRVMDISAAKKLLNINQIHL